MASIEEAIETAVRAALRDEMRALREELAAYRTASNDDYVTLTEAAQITKVHIDTLRPMVRGMVKAGRLELYRIGSRDRILRSDLARVMKEGPRPAEGPSAQDIAAKALAKRRGH